MILQTKGLSLEQVDILYQNTTPIHSVAYRTQMLLDDVHASDARVHDKVQDEHMEKV
jgi:MFS transporter, SP family, sugar:H+ symporter